MKLMENTLTQTKTYAGLLIRPPGGVEPNSACYLVSTFSATHSGLVNMKSSVLAGRTFPDGKVSAWCGIAPNPNPNP